MNTPIGRVVRYMALGSVVAGMSVAWAIWGHASPKGPTTPEVAQARALSRAFRVAAGQVLPAVVMVRNTIPTKEPSASSDDSHRSPSKGSPLEDLFRDPYWRKFFEGTPSMPSGPQVSMGSGVVIDRSGLILTNHHVVAGGGIVRVRLHDGREFDAADIKSDARTDLAVIRIEGAGNLSSAELGDSDLVETGDWVLAVGAPFGLDETVTAGIISAKNRGLGITAREEFLQTDAAINPGNSGGPLIDVEGRVVGINTAISTRSGGYQGVGFAVPIKLAHWVSEQLIRHGSVRRAYLGVSIQTLTSELADQLGLKSHNGALVTEVHPDTPGSEAGLQPGDVVVEYAGQPVQGPHDLQAAVEKSEIDKSAQLIVVRAGKRVTLEVTVREQPATYGLRQTENAAPEEPKPSEFKSLGIEIGALGSDVAEQLGLKGVHGVLITSVLPGSPAELAGLRAAMAITQVNGKPVSSVDDFRAALSGRPLEEGVLLLVRTQEGSRFVVVKSRKTK